MKPLPITLAALLALPAAAGAQPAPAPDAERGARWSLMLGGGALAPVGEMRDGYQDGLVAGLRVGVRSRLGLGLQLAADYSPLPRRSQGADAPDTAYGTVALLPGWTIGRGTVRLQLSAGGGVAAEHAMTDEIAAAALAQIGLELHVTEGGGLVLLGGATRTFGDLGYQYAWGIGGLTLEF